MLRWLQGKAPMRARQFDEAIRVFEQVLGAGDADYSTGYDTRLFGALSFEAVAACHFKLGRYNEAAQFFERAAPGAAPRASSTGSSGAVPATRRRERRPRVPAALGLTLARWRRQTRS